MYKHIQLTKRKCIIISSFALSILLIIGTVIAQSSLSTITISGGPYPGAPTYTVFSESGMYYAKNSNGAIVWSSNNARTLFASVVAGASNYAVVSFAPGTYTLAASTYGLVVSKPLILIGNGATVQPSGVVQNVFFLVDGGSNSTIKNFKLDGNGFSDIGVDIWNSSRNIITENEIYNCKEYGVSITGNGAEASYNTIANNFIHDLSGGTYGTGVKASPLGSSGTGAGGTDNIVFNNRICNVAEHGIKFYGGQQHAMINSNTINYTGATGIASEGDFNTIQSNSIYNPNTYGIGVGTGAKGTGGHQNIGGNNIYSLRDAGGIGINTDVDNTTISGNGIYSPRSIGIRINANYTMVSGNTITSASTAIYMPSGFYNVIDGLVQQGISFATVNQAAGDYNQFSSLANKGSNLLVVGAAHNHISDSWNGTKYIANSDINAGSASIVAGTFVIVSHGMINQPESVVVTLNGYGNNTAVSSITATTFRVDVQVSGSYTVNWVAYSYE